MHDEEKRQAYYDGELAPAERTEFEAHLKGCLECRQALGRWRRVAKSLLEPPAVRPSDRFVAAVMAEVDALERPAPAGMRLPGWLVPSLALAAAVFVFYNSIPAHTALLDPDSMLLSGDGAPLTMVLGEREPRAGDVLDLALERQP